MRIYRCDKCGNEDPTPERMVTITHSRPDGGDMLERHFCSDKCYVPPTGPATDEPAETETA